jgi:hypothetical protein
MNIRSNAVLTALAAACALFLGLIVIARLPALVALPIAALPIALVVGRKILALSRASARSNASPQAAENTQEELPPQYQAQPVAGIPLPSAHQDYEFMFSATVYWVPAVRGVAAPGAIARSEIIRRAREIAQRRDPAQAALVTSEVEGLLADARPDPTNRVHVRAELVQLQLSDDDRQRLEQLASLRKQEEVWDYQRRQEQSRRRYLSEDVLKSPGSAVVWWLARNDSQPEKVAESIDTLTRLANAANNADANQAEGPAPVNAEFPAAEAASPQTPAEQFGTFMDSLDSLGDDARLLITKQMASLVEGHGYATVAREMTGPYDERPGGSDSEVPGEELEPRDW